MKSGRRFLYRDYIMGPTKVVTWDPCLFGQPMILTVVHIIAAALLTIAIATHRPSSEESTLAALDLIPLSIKQIGTNFGKLGSPFEWSCETTDS